MNQESVKAVVMSINALMERQHIDRSEFYEYLETYISGTLATKYLIKDSNVFTHGVGGLMAVVRDTPKDYETFIQDVANALFTSLHHPLFKCYQQAFE